MSEDTFQKNATEIVAAIGFCLNHHFRMPALVLIYCGIDFMAALGRPAKKTEADRKDFIEWAERYMDCQQRLGVSGLDLYAARCGIVHTHSADSRLSENRKARRIFYTWGNQTPDDANTLLRCLGRSEIMIKIETLYEVYADGAAAFADAIDRDLALNALVSRRARKLFMDHAAFP